jgi:isopentenyldiphosphate isomerase
VARPANRIGQCNTPFRLGRQSSKWREYSDKKQAWVKAHPEAGSREIDAAARRIAKELGL